ncbi:hypothetical protein QN277_000653 [Acacia crassicarpa]|uniref:Late embryogenesis abundant protein LEA-2 subgroup domain-containing protein n=1 Tax=Acacia crassicarpa TaxID=499986 RepID=A0AAE1TG84_9FABA|nr:hypothetical protein QN277_000653 [Acacia crassicarpa]
MTGKGDFVRYSPLPGNPSPSPAPSNQNVVIVLPAYRPPYSRRNSWYLRCSGAFFFILLLTAATFFIYPSDPDIQVVRIHLNDIGIKTSPKLVLDLSFFLSVKVKNRNFFSISYDYIDISVGYRGRELGSVSSNGGRLRARGSSYVNATLDLDGFQVIHDVFYLLEDLAKGVIPFDTETRVEGNLRLLFLNFPLKATVLCLVYVDTSNQTVMRQDCYPESLG